MNLSNFKVTLLLSFFSYCLAYKQELFSKEWTRLKREADEQEIKYPLEKNCSNYFNSIFERDESIKKGYLISKLTITGSVIRFSDIPPANYCEGRILVLELFATETIIFDENYNSNGLDVYLTVAAPTWIVIGHDRKVILAGENGKLPSRGKNTKKSINGADGKEGDVGGHGGNFYGIGVDFLWQSDEGITKNDNENNEFHMCYTKNDEYLEYKICRDKLHLANSNFSIKFYLNGGNGSRGQDGGDGLEGRDGTVFNLDKKMMRRDGNVQGFETILRKDVKAPLNESHLGSGFSQVILGDLATLGGRGGNAGPGGLGGQPGGAIFISLAEVDCFVTTPISSVRGNKGKDGKDGRIGLFGFEGKPGSDIRLSVYSSPSGGLELRDIQYFKHKPLYLTHSFQKNIVSERQKIPERISPIYGYSSAASNYKNFVYDHLENTPNGRMQRKIFELFHICYISICTGYC